MSIFIIIMLTQLASDLGRESNSMLWLGIVGLTDELIHDKIDTIIYSEHAEELRKAVLRLNG